MKHFFGLAVLVTSSLALANGFSISEQDASASGRSGTALARKATPSSVYFNPAGLAGTTEVSALAGVTAIAPTIHLTDSSGKELGSTSGFVTPPHAYASFGGEKWGAGVGFNAPFGGSVNWPVDWAGRFELTSLNLQALAGHLGAAYQIAPPLSIGASVSMMRVSFATTKSADFVDREGTAALAGTGMAATGTLGATYQLAKTVRLGVSGKLPSTAHVHGRAHFDSVPPAYAGILQDQAFSTAFNFPGKIGAGFEAEAFKLRWFADAELTFWSSFQSLDIDFEQSATPDVQQAKRWNDAPTFRVGAELPLEKYLGAGGVLRAGLVYDVTAAPADTVTLSQPDGNRIGGSLGVGASLGPVHADLAYSLVALMGMSANLGATSGTPSVQAHLFSFSLSRAPNSKAKVVSTSAPAEAVAAR